MRTGRYLVGLVTAAGLLLSGCQGGSIAPPASGPIVAPAAASRDDAAVVAAKKLRRPVLRQNDFEYLGAFAVPEEAVDWSTAYAFGGLALRHTAKGIHFFATTHVYSGGLVYEMNDPGLSMTHPPTAKIVKPWGDIYQGHKCLSAAEGGCELQANNWTEGLYYDESLQRLYWSYGFNYDVTGTNDPVLGYTTFSRGQARAFGPWATGTSGAPSQMVRGGSLRIPAWFAKAYTGGASLGLGFGGYYSGDQYASHGPALFATTDPPTSGSTLATTELLAYPNNHLAIRDTNYDSTNISYDRNPKNGVGYWTWADNNFGGGIWLDLPTKQGVLFFPQWGTGDICYKCYSDCGGVCASGYEGAWYVYDPKDLAAVALGKEKPWQPKPTFWVMPQYPLGGAQVTGVAFDDQTDNLYLYVYQSYNCSQIAGCFPLVYAYHVNG